MPCFPSLFQNFTRIKLHTLKSNTMHLILLSSLCMRANGRCTEKSAVGTIGRDKFINIGYMNQNIFSLFSDTSTSITINANSKRNTTKGFVLPDTNGNIFHIGYDSLGSLIIRTANVDRAGHTTQVFALLGKRLHPDDNDFAKFRELMRRNNIPEENLIDMSKTEKCPKNERGTNPS
ncbi:odorant-binding protein-like isoform X2 [Herpailurus yagouaroundi]|uniref:odorant-binding protein-like isoform X2 n=1 Tax=Herpailurus yagouaroundi TaxID=1608482 RepID=UPI001AD6DFA6|nr:odorant-binding protein-like isoform X2 [Puma yagouaroundi]